MTNKIIIRPVHSLLCLLLLTSIGIAQAPSAESKVKKPRGGQNDQEAKDQILKRLDLIQDELKRLNQTFDDSSDKTVRVDIDSPALGSTYYSPLGTNRFFVTRLSIVNLEKKSLEVLRSDISLVADNKTYPAKEIPAGLRNRWFQVGNRTIAFREIKAVEKVTVPKNGLTKMWVVFTGIPPSNHVPQLELRLKLNGSVRKLSVNAYNAGLLKLRVDRIGPRDCLGLMTIEGLLNTINVTEFAKAVDQLASQNVARIVVRWSKTAPPADSVVLSWLQQSAAQAGNETITNRQFRALSTSIKELHLAELPKQNKSTKRRMTSTFQFGFGVIQTVNQTKTAVVHSSTRDAVWAALKSAYEVLPAVEIRNEIQNAHVLTRAAALALGAAQLRAIDLPFVLELALQKDNDEMRRAALIALGHFGESQAISALGEVAGHQNDDMSLIAVESLASSRFQEAHRTLMTILKESTPQRQKKVIPVLAQFRQPIWSNMIFAYVSDQSVELDSTSLRALVQIGHPLLVVVLERALKSKNAEVRGIAFEALATSLDPQSERLAVDYTLNHLKESMPTSNMQKLLLRTKDRRAVPLLIERMTATKNNVSTIINTLGEIGDETTAAFLVTEFPKRNSNEKPAILNALVKLKSPDLRRLAGEALKQKSRSSTLARAACNALRTDPSPEASRMLISAFEAASDISTISATSYALSSLATPQARAALIKARTSENKYKRSYSSSALMSIYARSLGASYVIKARLADQQDDWNTAVELYSLALKLDHELATAYVGRGNNYVRINNIKAARADFEKAIKLDPSDSLPISGLALVMVMQGDVVKGIEFVEELKKKFKTEFLFSYNLACVYGRAVEYIKRRKDFPDRETHLKKYRDKAIVELKLAVERGFRDLDWMKRDPDLKSLQDLPQFKQIHSPNATNADPQKPAK